MSVFDASDLPTEQRFEAYRAAIGRDLDTVQPTEAWHREPAVRRIIWTTKDMTVRWVKNGGIRFTLRPAAGYQSRDQVMVIQCVSGGSQGLLGEDAYINRPDVIAVQDLATPMRGIIASRSEFITVALPRFAVAGPGQSIPRLTLDSDEPLGRLAGTMLRTLVEALPSATAAEGAALSLAMTGFIRGLLAGRRADEDARAAFDRTRANALRRYIEENLTDRGLSIGRLCAAVGASHATIYRVFATEGGVEKYIKHHRLRAAYADLSYAAPTRGIVAQISYRWGFDDPSQFARAFRVEFGTTPSEVVGTMREHN